MKKIIAQNQYSFSVHDEDPSRDGNLNPKVIHETWVENVYRIAEGDFYGENPSFVDLGANIGVVSLWVDRFNATREDKIKIIAVEPEPTNAKLFAHNWLHNPHYTDAILIQLAVHHDNRTVKISPQGANANILDGVGTEVNTITLSQIMQQNDLEEISVLKVDIEGSEFDLIINTPEEVMNKLRYIVIETDATDKHTFGLLISKLTDTHTVQTLGHYDRGTYLWCRRY